jgi:hypothetical protein
VKEDEKITPSGIETGGRGDKLYSLYELYSHKLVQIG